MQGLLRVRHLPTQPPAEPPPPICDAQHSGLSQPQRRGPGGHRLVALTCQETPTPPEPGRGRSTHGSTPLQGPTRPTPDGGPLAGGGRRERRQPESVSQRCPHVCKPSCQPAARRASGVRRGMARAARRAADGLVGSTRMAAWAGPRSLGRSRPPQLAFRARAGRAEPGPAGPGRAWAGPRSRGQSRPGPGPPARAGRAELGPAGPGRAWAGPRSLEAFPPVPARARRPSGPHL